MNGRGGHGVGGGGGGGRNASWKYDRKSYKSEVAINLIYFYLHQPGNCVGKDTSKQNN